MRVLVLSERRSGSTFFFFLEEGEREGRRGREVREGRFFLEWVREERRSTFFGREG